VGRGVSFNFHAAGPWQDKRVRQAINLAIDRDMFCSLIENCTVGVWAGGATYITTDRDEMAARFPGYARTGPAKDTEIAEAKRLMEAAGWPDGFQVVAMCRDTIEYRDHNCPAMEFLLRETLNIRMTLDVQESGAYTEKGRTGDWLMEMAAVGGARIDHPFEWLRAGGFCGQTPRDSKRGYCNEEVDQLLLQSRTMSEVAALQPLSDEILEIFKVEVPWVPVFWPNRWVVYWNYVKGTATETASGQYTQSLRMEHVWLDQ
jgi:ABC-type transport system substrate-binding protein